MKENYFKLVTMLERLHRLFLEALKVELGRMNVRDINNVQCLILYNIGQERVTIGELTSRGYYLGSNVSYNLRKMVQNGYLLQHMSLHDRRLTLVGLSEKGQELYNKLHKVFTRQVQALSHEGMSDQKMAEIGNGLVILEKFWTSLL